MRRFRRNPLNLLAVMALALCGATGLLWIRSYWRVDSRWSIAVAPDGHDQRTVNLVSVRGRLLRHQEHLSGGAQFSATGPHSGFELGRSISQSQRVWINPPPGKGSAGFFVAETRTEYPAVGMIWETRIAAVPYWAVFAPAVVAAVLLTRAALRGATAERRRLSGRCPSCDYDLRATPGRCPECGAVPASAQGSASD